MTKIKAQKVPKNRIVNIVPSAARILDRLATNGGIAILCGQYLKAEDKKGKTKKVGKTATIDNTKSKNKHADTIIEIKTVFEVSTGYDSAENKILISQEMNDVNKAVKIAESLVGTYTYIYTHLCILLHICMLPRLLWMLHKYKFTFQLRFSLYSVREGICCSWLLHWFQAFK